MVRTRAHPAEEEAVRTAPSLIATALLVSACSDTIPTPSTPTLRQEATMTPTLSQQRHAALAQYYRWYQLYERPITPARIELQLEILRPDIYLESMLGKGEGHERYVG